MNAGSEYKTSFLGHEQGAPIDPSPAGAPIQNGWKKDTRTVGVPDKAIITELCLQCYTSRSDSRFEAEIGQHSSLAGPLETLTYVGILNLSHICKF